MCEEYNSSYVYCGLGVLAFLVCMCAILMVYEKNIRDQLCASVVYRLYVYQVVGATLFSLVCIFQPVAFHFDYNGSTGQCSFIAFLDQFTQCLKLTLLAGVTVYLACSIRQSQCTKNFTTIHEVIYIAASIIIAGVFACIPAFTNTYGNAGGWCWIQSVKVNCSGFIESTYRPGIPEQFVLWYVPAVLLCLAGIIVLGMYACFMIRCPEKLDEPGEAETLMNPELDKKVKSTAINKSHLVALILYQICFFVFLFIPFIYRIISPLNSYTNPSKVFQLLAAICAPLWSLFSGAILMGYNVFIWKGCKKTEAN